MKIKCVIVGGGVAGLSAAIRLAELGEAPLVIEGGDYPTHKVCGEFLSSECLRYLHEWNIFPTPIPQVSLTMDHAHINFSFPSHAGGLSHLLLDPMLVQEALKKGVIIKTQTQVVSFHPKKLNGSEFHRIQLFSGEVLEAAKVVFATGRIPSYSLKLPKISYIGFKAHFKNLPSEGQLQMFSFPGAYLGIAPIEENKYNVACLASINTVKDQNPQMFIQNLISQNSTLAHLTTENNLFDQWMMASLPAFGIKKTPEWLDAYFIGDASVSIPPACGNGLSLAIIGGRLAAEYALKGQFQEFKNRWTVCCSSQMRWAKMLHHLMLNPGYSYPLVHLAKAFPFLSHKIFEFTRCDPSS